MLASITPLGERGRGRRWGITASWFVVGSILGGAGLGAVCGAAALVLAAAGLSDEVVLIVLAGALITFAAVDLGIGRLRMIGPTRQVNDGWMYEYRGWVYGFGFGLQLGFGVATVVITAAVYGMIVASIATGSVTAAVAVGAAFGLTRGLTALPGARVKQPSDLGVLNQWLARWDRSSRLAVAGLQVVLAAIAIAVALGV